MLIIYAIVAEQSVGEMFIAGFIPGVLLAAAFVVGIFIMSYVTPKFIGGDEHRDEAPEDLSVGIHHEPFACDLRLFRYRGRHMIPLAAGALKRRDCKRVI